MIKQINELNSVRSIKIFDAEVDGIDENERDSVESKKPRIISGKRMEKTGISYRANQHCIASFCFFHIPFYSSTQQFYSRLSLLRLCVLLVCYSKSYCFYIVTLFRYIKVEVILIFNILEYLAPIRLVCSSSLTLNHRFQCLICYYYRFL